MKTIEEAAKKYSLNEWHSDITPSSIFEQSEKDFKSGVEFAQRWIPVDEELPEKKDHNFSDLVLTKNSFNNILIERYDFEYNHFNAVRYDAVKKGDGQVSHWRPIYLK